ncbi:MAG: hypothetical protein MOGMAGMI_00257 [Candidatus Omnitrophica bacterium]|nr:hypothetical protein [Candidatus Omnitrophota bacterium]
MAAGRDLRGPRQGARRSFFVVSWAVSALAAALVTAGCGPRYTYPASTVPSSIERIALSEYKLEVEARVVGRTVGAALYLDSIVDATGQIPKDVHEQMGQLMQVVTRVALSTDLSLDYCTVLIRDTKTFAELNITRSLDDIKRANADAIGIEESINRTLFGQGRYHPGPEGSRPPLVIEDVRKEKFLTEQIAQRIRFSLAKDGQEGAVQGFTLVDGNFDESGGRRVFRFSVLTLKSEDPRETILEIFKLTNQVLQGYRYGDFDRIEIQDYLNRQKLIIDRQVLFDYQQKKILDREILERFLTESQSIQEAFKLFGFSMPAE